MKRLISPKIAFWYQNSVTEKLEELRRLFLHIFLAQKKALC